MAKEIAELKPAEYNPRKISKQQLDSLKKAMIAFGDLSGIVVNKRSGRVVGGHQRLRNLEPHWKIVSKPAKDDTGTIALGHIETPFGQISYRLVDWPKDKEKAVNLAANKHGGDWDMPKLNLVIEDLKESDFDIELTGFSPDEFLFEANASDINEAEQSLDGLKYQVVVDCAGESEQIDLIQQLEDRGFKCQPLIL